jgi:alcohol dehydrogenase class IV
MEDFGLRAKARLVAIPTTSGTGAEVTLATTLTDTEAHRKLGLGSYELIPDIAIVDPSLVMGLPAAITADTGMDVLAHAVEGYTSRCSNDFSDGLCLKAIQLVFKYLPRAYEDGSDTTAREHMHNAATIAGLGFGNSMAALAHAMGHALGSVLHIAHGRAVSLYLPYTVEFVANAGDSRYADIAYALHLPAKDEVEGASRVVCAIRELMSALDQPMCMQDLTITLDTFEGVLPQLISNAESDTQLVMSTRIPDSKELERLFRYAFEGTSIDF